VSDIECETCSVRNGHRVIHEAPDCGTMSNIDTLRAQLESVTRERDGLSENLYVANLAAVQAAKERDVLKAALEEIMIEVGTSTLAHKIARAALERLGARKGEG
jgi:uncharacterized protein involved in exopolysaccharide biosynthesis